MWFFWLLFICFRCIVILDSVAWNFPATISYRYYFFPILSQLSLWWYNNRYVRLNHNTYPFEYMYFQFQNFCDFHCNLQSLPKCSLTLYSLNISMTDIIIWKYMSNNCIICSSICILYCLLLAFFSTISFHHTIQLIFNKFLVFNIIYWGDTMRLWMILSPSNDGLFLLCTGSCARVGSL